MMPRELANLLGCECSERKPAADSLPVQLSQRMLKSWIAVPFRRAQRTEEQEAIGSPPTGEEGQQVERRRVGPLQVIEQHDKRYPRCYRAQEVANCFEESKTRLFGRESVA